MLAFCDQKSPIFSVHQDASYRPLKGDVSNSKFQAWDIQFKAREIIVVVFLRQNETPLIPFIDLN